MPTQLLLAATARRAKRKIDGSTSCGINLYFFAEADSAAYPL
jgi:hypothetical protein